MSFVLTKGTDNEYTTEFAYVACAYACIASKTRLYTDVDLPFMYL